MNSSQLSRVKWPFIKVCGIRTPEEGVLALDCGANAIGLLIGLTHRAEDKIDDTQGQLITGIVRKSYPDACTVMVTHLLDPDTVADLANRLDATAIQVHDDMLPTDMARLQKKCPDRFLIKAIHIEGSSATQVRAVIEKANQYQNVADAFLTDSKSIDPDGAIRLGGTGKQHDAGIGRALIDAFPGMPIILAGGLNPSNVAAAIQRIRPAGIDANSGLENADGSKNPDKIHAFVQAGLFMKIYNRPIKKAPIWTL